MNLTSLKTKTMGLSGWETSWPYRYSFRIRQSPDGRTYRRMEMLYGYRALQH